MIFDATLLLIFYTRRMMLLPPDAAAALLHAVAMPLTPITICRYVMLPIISLATPLRLHCCRHAFAMRYATRLRCLFVARY